jgi:hypothetical protein
MNAFHPKPISARPAWHSQFRRHVRGIAFVMAAVALTAAPAMAASNATVLEQCKSSDWESVQTAMITGVAMGLLFGQSLGGPQRAYCPPNDGRLSAGQYRLAVCKYLETHPAIASQENYAAVGMALLGTYPCPSPNK